MVNFEECLNLALEKHGTARAKINRKSILKNNRNLYVIGKNHESSKCIKIFEVKGLISDFDNCSDRWNGLPIVSTREIPNNSLIINCVTSISPVQVNRNLRAAGLTNILEYSDLISDDDQIIPHPWFVLQQRAEMLQYISWWKDLYNLLSDDASRVVFLDVLRYRLTARSEYMSDYQVRLKDQYFEDFMQYNDEYFIDAGGYDGNTTEEFITRYPNYKKVYFFEPDHINLLRAKQRLTGRRDIEFKFVGLSDASGTLHFNANAGSASAVTNTSKDSISTVALDAELRNDPISSIKMDIEGWEMNALRGATQIINNIKPKLAIAVYHSARDFREIPQHLLNLNPNYKIYLRHYTQGWSETVMYFI